MQLFGTSAPPVLGLPQLRQGDQLFVDGPLNYDGTANLKTYNDKTISFDISIKASNKIMGFDLKIPFNINNGLLNVNVELNKISDGQYNLVITDRNNPSFKQTETVSASERMVGNNKEITFSSNNKVRCTFNAAPDGTIAISAPGAPFSVTMSKTNSYGADSYNTSPYSSGYSQGMMVAAPVAQTITGIATGVSSMSSSVGGIFNTIFNLVASILNTVANLVSKMVSGVLGLFGVGKKDKSEGIQSNSGGQPPVAMNNQQSPGAMSGVNNPQQDIQQVYPIANQELRSVQNPNQGVKIIDLHVQKAKDYRDKAEDLAQEAEKESKNTLALAQKLQKNPSDSSTLSKLQASKAKAMTLINSAKEAAQGVYNEALYVQASTDILNNKFQGALGQNGNKVVQDTWKNWTGGATEKQMLFFNKNLKSAPEALQIASNSVNANIGRAVQIISSLPVRT